MLHVYTFLHAIPNWFSLWYEKPRIFLIQMTSFTDDVSYVIWLLMCVNKASYWCSSVVARKLVSCEHRIENSNERTCMMMMAEGKNSNRLKYSAHYFWIEGSLKRTMIDSNFWSILLWFYRAVLQKRTEKN